MTAQMELASLASGILSWREQARDNEMSPNDRRPDYDQTLKRLLTRAHDGFVALLLPGARWLEERSVELPAVRRQADLVWEVEVNGERLLLHVELQTNPDPHIDERLAEYGLRLWLRDHLPVRSVVVYLREGGRIPPGPFVISRGGGEEGLRYRYDIVRLWQESAERVLEGAEVRLWPLAALMAGVTADTVMAVAERIAQAPLSLGEGGSDRSARCTRRPATPASAGGTGGQEEPDAS